MFMGTTPFITVRARRPLTEIEFCAWVAQAVPGDRLEYHRGFLVLDIFPMFARLPDQQRAELARLGSRAFWAAGAFFDAWSSRMMAAISPWAERTCCSTFSSCCWQNATRAAPRR